MPFGPHIIDLVESCLSECFKFHGALDTLVLRSGYARDKLDAARARAEDRCKQSARAFARAPKRFVAQEILRDLSDQGAEGDRPMAAIITALTKGTFPDATPDGIEALARLKAARAIEAQEAADRRADRERQKRDAERSEEVAAARKRAIREAFLQRFSDLVMMTDAQARGYALEKFLNDFFDYERLEPRGSFKLIGEQIDGSFAWNARTSLVEARWVKLPIAGAEFGAFIYKIDGKTADTRGLFISINGYSPEAIEGLKGKGALRFICIDGAHLMRCLQPGLCLPSLLDILWRHADETGEAYLPVSSKAFRDREVSRRLS